MRAFRRVSRGLACGLDDWERELLARLALEVRALLRADGSSDGADGPTFGSAGGPAGTAPSGGTDPGRPGESRRDREVLAALDFDIELRTDRLPGPVAGTGVDPVVETLLPEASEDPATAMEISALIRRRLRDDKADRLARVAAQMRAPSGPEGTILVAWGEEADWLGAINDIRLVLAQRLDIDSAQDAEHVHSLVFQNPPDRETPHERWYRGTALVYDMVTWWQESLVSALFGSTGPA